MFKAVKEMNKISRKPNANKIFDGNNKLTTDPDKISLITKKHYENKFYDKE